ncbi:MAG: Rrf2 family transcriptional regulator [Sphingomonadaceae bacterium]
MRLTLYTDYSLRVLIHLALHEERLCSIGEIARTYEISHNHLMKVVVALARGGFVETARGRMGGLRLARDATEISVGEVVRHTEEGLQLANCSECSLSPACGLTGVLAQGMAAMLNVFDSFTIADLLTDKAAMRRHVARESPLGIGMR